MGGGGSRRANRRFQLFSWHHQHAGDNRRRRHFTTKFREPPFTCVHCSGLERGGPITRLPNIAIPLCHYYAITAPAIAGRNLREILPPHDPRALIRSTQPAAISTSVCLARCVQCVFTSGALPVRRRCIPRACDDGSEHARPARGRQAPYSTPASYLTPASGCQKSHRGVPGVQARGEMSQVQEESELVRHGPT
jgi:hypothetical protein